MLRAPVGTLLPMVTNTTTITDAITRSTSHNERVSLQCTGETLQQMHNELLRRSDDWAEDGEGGYDYWAHDPQDDDADLWRVSLAAK